MILYNYNLSFNLTSNSILITNESAHLYTYNNLRDCIYSKGGTSVQQDLK